MGVFSEWPQYCFQNYHIWYREFIGSIIITDYNEPHVFQPVVLLETGPFYTVDCNIRSSMLSKAVVFGLSISVIVIRSSFVAK